MDRLEMVFIAKLAVEKNMSYETLKYSDCMYERENFTDAVWEYVEECRKIGTKAFYEKYDV